MMKWISALIFTTTYCVFAAFAQQPTPTPEPVKGPTYDEMVAKLKGGDTAIDFKALRMAFTQTKAYGPYGGDRDSQKAAFGALVEEKYKDAVKKAEEMLAHDYTDMDAQIAASLGYRGLGDNAKADFHKTVYLGLVNSIINSGDGKTEKTAYVVVTTHEEYIVLRALGLIPGSQSLVTKDGHTFDVLTAIDSKTKESVKIYFNIDIVWKAETDMFKSKG